MFAKVIVDVPAKQVNRTFDYEIPIHYEGVIEIGMRVAVPFSNRLVQGFVVDIVDKTNFDGVVLPIDRPLDLEPVLNQEMILLGQFMAQHTYTFLVTCYQTILPPMLKSSYQKRFVLKNREATDEIIYELFAGKCYIDVDSSTDNAVLAKLLHLRKQGIVELEHVVQSRITKKTESWIRSLVTEDVARKEKIKLRKSAQKQASLLDFLGRMNPKEITRKEFVKQTMATSSDIKVASEKRWLVVENREQARDPYANRQFQVSQKLILNQGQQTVFNQVMSDMDAGLAKTYLLHGITGSGKTELYLQWIQKSLEEGKTAVVLVPEISLTPQMVERFKSRFGEAVAVLHSGLSAGEKYDEWRKIKAGEASIVVGARSSIFAPLENIGMIIIDEEHESSYKQDEAPRYHARDIAIWRGKYHQCPVILGSATPSLESRARAQKNVYQLLELKQRAKAQTLPTVEIVDMRQEFSKQNHSIFSNTLLEKIKNRLEKREQVVLLLNRRGYSSFLMCRDCGHVVQCPNCDISLTLHMDTRTMKCHYCGHEEAIPRRCPKCGGDKIRYYGTGTQKVEEQLKELLPEVKILRMDVDTTRKKGQHEALLKSFENHEADILLGTQMIAKGLDFPLVTLVGVLNADTALNLPDFRSFERTFQLLTQVAGRAGRAELPGEVVIQTYNPDHYAIQLASHHNYDDFYLREMKIRHMGQYPPYVFTTMITVSSEEEGSALRKAVEIQKFLAQHLQSEAVILGPTAKSVARVNNRYYFQILLKYRKETSLPILLNDILNQSQGQSSNKVTVAIDVEPMSFL